MSLLGRGGKLFEASRILDDHDARMIMARYEGRPFFLVTGRDRRRSEDTTVKSSVEEQTRGENKEEVKFLWDFLFTPSNIPGFMRIDQFKTLATLVASASSGTKIDMDHATFTPTISFGGANVRWDLTQLINKYLDSIGATNYVLDEGPEVECSRANKELALIYFSLKNVALKKMGIADLALDLVYVELSSRESGLCSVVISQIEFAEDHKPTTEDATKEVETLEKKLRTEFADSFKEFVKNTITKG